MIITKTFSELNTEELYQILRLRSEVFVVEQDCVYQDIDNKDQKAIHLYCKENEEILGYTRIFKAGHYYENPSIGRVVVSKKDRGKDVRKKIMIDSIEYIYDVHINYKFSKTTSNNQRKKNNNNRRKQSKRKKKMLLERR